MCAVLRSGRPKVDRGGSRAPGPLKTAGGPYRTCVAPAFSVTPSTQSGTGGDEPAPRAHASATIIGCHSAGSERLNHQARCASLDRRAMVGALLDPCERRRAGGLVDSSGDAGESTAQTGLLRKRNNRGDPLAHLSAG